VAVTRRSSRSRFTLVLLVLSSITLLTLDYRGFAPLDSARSAVLAVVSPVGDAASAVFRPVGDFWSNAFDSGDLKAENEDLRRQVDDLQGKITQGEASRQELEKLKTSLDIPFAGEIPQVHARAASGPVSNFDATIEIDKGASSQIKKGMPVVAGGGLVGTVVNVSDSRAVVKLIIDRDFQVGVSTPGKPGRGVVQGQGDEITVHASQFAMSSELNKDDILQTIGGRSLFPPGIPVGTVTSVGTDDTTQQKVADVKLTANLSDLTFVTVLLYEPPNE
jgi:rod shape-determining protein MreC